jgi:hypothetical protein
MKMLPVLFEENGRQIEEAAEFGNQTRTDRSDRGPVSRGHAYRKEEDPRRIHQGDGLSPEARYPGVKAARRE